MAPKLAIPTNPDDLREFVQDPARIQAAFKDPEAAVDFMEQYRKAANAEDPELDEQAEQAKAKSFIDILEKAGFVKQDARTTRLPMAETSTPANHRGQKAMYNHLGASRKSLIQIAATGRGPGVGHTGWEDSEFSDFLEAAITLLAGKGGDVRLKDMSELIPGDGGVLVPEEFRAELMMLALEEAVIRSRARVIPMGSSSLRYPTIRDTSHATNVFGGMSGTWVAEGGSVSSATNQPSFSSVRLVANKLTAYSVASNELLSDSAISLEALILSLYPQAVAYFEDDAFINGTGVGQPLGIINAAALVSIAKETGQAATTLVWENLLNMYARMLPSSIGRAVWIAHNDVFPQLAVLALSVGTGGGPVWMGNGVGSPPITILGRPVIFTEKAQTLGTAGDIFFVDLSHYLIGDRQALTMNRSEHVLFTTDEIVWRFIQRLDGRPWLTSALTPRNGSNTVSPYLNLATRA
jgi:HK97 family phage major capsid protein